jgi:hypothetical protein
VADQHGRPAEVADHRDQVTRDGGTAVGRPLRARLAGAAQVDGSDPVAGGDQLRRHESVRRAAVTHAVGQHDQRPVTGHLVGDGAGADGQELGHNDLLAVLALAI